MRIFVVVTYTKSQLLEKCLATLEKANAGLWGWRTVVVHNGGPEPMRRWINERWGQDPRYRLVFLPENLRFSAAANAGIREACSMGASAVVLVNDDIEFTGPVLPAVDEALSDPSIGLIGAKLLYPDGLIQHAGMRRIRHEVHHRFIGEPGSTPAANVPADVCVTGALIAWRRDVLDRVGFLDEEFRRASEDLDYCLRVLKAGYRVVYWPAFLAIHLEGATRGRSDREKGAVAVADERHARRRLVEKWGGFLKESVKAEGSPQVLYVSLDQASEGAARATADCHGLSRRGWTCRLVAGPGPDDVKWILSTAGPGVVVAAGWGEASIVARSLSSGQAGFVLVPPGAAVPPADMGDLWIRSLRALLASQDDAQALWRTSGADLAVVPAGGDARWDALEDLFWEGPRQVGPAGHRQAPAGTRAGPQVRKHRIVSTDAPPANFTASPKAPAAQGNDSGGGSGFKARPARNSQSEATPNFNASPKPPPGKSSDGFRIRRPVRIGPGPESRQFRVKNRPARP